MPKKTDVDVWLGRETEHVRKALENASRYFARTDPLTVNTLEAIYGQESSFGVLRRSRGMDGAAGDFHLQKDTAERYGLIVSKENDQRFDIDYAAITAARYLKDLNTMFGKSTKLSDGRMTIPVGSIQERKKFVLAAYNLGEGRVAYAQELARQVGKDATSWKAVQTFLEAAGSKKKEAKDGRAYVPDVLKNEDEFSQKSLADKKLKNKRPGKTKGTCIKGHWITKDHHHIFICS